MAHEQKVSRVMKALRAVALGVMFLALGFATPDEASACGEQLLTCSTAEACVSVVNNSCDAGGCPGIVKCKPHADCDGEHNVGTVCVPEGLS